VKPVTVRLRERGSRADNRAEVIEWLSQAYAASELPTLRSCCVARG
jgi:hypothetical protein